MSDVIDEEQHIRTEPQKGYQAAQNEPTWNNQMKYTVELIREKLNSNGQNSDSSLFFSEDQNKYILKIAMGGNFSVVVNVCYNLKKKSMYIFTNILKNEVLFSLPTKELRLNIKGFIDKIIEDFHSCTCTINQESGILVIKDYCFISLKQPLNANFIFSFLTNQIVNMINCGEKLIKFLKRFLFDLSFYTPEKIPKSLKTEKQKIEKYLTLSFLELDASKSQGTPFEMFEEGVLKERAVYEECMKEKIDKSMIKRSLILYQTDDEQEQIDEIKLTEKEIDEMGGVLKFPKPKIDSPYENEFIFNEISILNNCDKLPSIPIYSGNTNLQAIKLKFCYEHSESESSQNNGTPIEKVVLLKTPNKQNSKNTVQHELNIVKNFKSSNSAYIIKYYSTMKGTLANKLLMDFYGKFQNLNEYLQKNKKSMQLITKVMILMNIANGLRFLKQRKIVHMDLNLNNLIVTRNLIPKIIDFGEAYNSRICRKDKYKYSPGFTVPFGPPQVFRAKEYSSKSDIFSLGIIFFTLVFGRLPFNPTKSLIESFRKQEYPSRLFLAPEEVQYLGNEKEMLYIVSLISRMINPKVMFRPYPTWVRVICRYIQIYHLSLQNL